MKDKNINKVKKSDLKIFEIRFQNLIFVIRLFGIRKFWEAVGSLKIVPPKTYVLLFLGITCNVYVTDRNYVMHYRLQECKGSDSGVRKWEPIAFYKSTKKTGDGSDGWKIWKELIQLTSDHELLSGS